MVSAFFAHQAVRLIKAFPKVTERLDDLSPIPSEFEDFLEDGVIQSLGSTCDKLVSNNIIHVGRFEARTQPNDFTRTEIEALEKNLVSLVDFLITRPKTERLKIKDIPNDDNDKLPNPDPRLEALFVINNGQHSEFESVFITLYTILLALEEDSAKFNTFFNNNSLSTPLLFAKAAELSNNGLGVNGNDNPYNHHAHHTLYVQLWTENTCTLPQWDKLTLHILAALDLLVLAGPDTWSDLKDEIDAKDLLFEYAKRGRLLEIGNLMRGSGSADYKRAFLENASIILMSAAEHLQFNTMQYLLTLYEDNIKEYSLNPEQDLNTPPDMYSLLAMVLFHGNIGMMNTLIRLQKGPRFKPMDRNLIFFYTDYEWNNAELREHRKSHVGKTLLHMAARHNYSTLIKPLIEQAGINLNDKTYYTEMTALQIAENLKQDDAAKILRELTTTPITGQKNHYDAENDENGGAKKKVKIN